MSDAWRLSRLACFYVIAVFLLASRPLSSFAADTLEIIKSRGQLLWGADAEGGAPYVFPNPQKPEELTGFEYDLAEALAAKLGVKARMDGPPEDVVPCLKAMHASGKGVLGMKILGEGTFKSAEQQLASLKFVLGLGCVDAFVIGFESPEQIDQICTHIEAVLKQ